MTGQELKQILDDANVRVVEAAKIFRVSTSTLYRWMEGVPPKQKVVFELAELHAGRIRAAKDMGILPPRSKGSYRLAEIKAAMNKMAAEGKC